MHDPMTAAPVAMQSPQLDPVALPLRTTSEHADRRLTHARSLWSKRKGSTRHPSRSVLVRSDRLWASNGRFVHDDVSVNGPSNPLSPLVSRLMSPERQSVSQRKNA